MAQVPATDVEYTGNGSQTQFTVPFEFISRAYVFVTVDGVSTPFTWINDALVEITPAPVNGAAIRIYRDTPAFEAFHLFARGVPFLPRYVDENNTQLLDAVQEAVNDTAGDASAALAVANAALDTANRAEDKVDNAIILSAEQLRLDLADGTNISKGSRLVAWLANIPGAVFRWVSDKLADQLSFKDFGLVGDGSDETVKLQAAFAAAAGKRLTAEPGKVYLTTDELVIPSYADIDFCGSQLNYTINVNGKNCLRFQNCTGAKVRNVTIRPVGVTFGDHGGSRMPVVLGEYGNTFGNTPNRDILLENVTVRGGFAAMNAFAIFGDSARVKLVNPKVIGEVAPASAGIGILVHWSADNTGTPTTTYHPHDIIIENPYFEKTALGTVQEQPSCIFLSAAHNVTITNLIGDDINTGVYVYPGDFGYTFARPSDGTAVRNIRIVNPTMRAIRKFGVYVLGQANGVGPSLPMGVTVDRGHLSGGNIGLRARRCSIGVLFQDVYVTAAGSGVVFAECFSARLLRCDVTNNTGLGVYLTTCTRCLVRDCTVWNNNTSGLVTQLGSAVYIDGGSLRCVIDNCELGSSVPFEYYGVRINGTTNFRNRITNNVFWNFTSGIAIANESSAPATVRTYGRGNVFMGSETNISGTLIDVGSDGRDTMCFTASQTWDPPSVTSASSASVIVPVTGAALGDRVTAAFSRSLGGLALNAYVSSANNVTVVLFSSTGATVDLASGTLSVEVTRYL